MDRIPGFELECKGWLANWVYFSKATGVANVDEICKSSSPAAYNFDNKFWKRLKPNL